MFRCSDSTLIVSMLTCVLFSLVPAIRASRPDVVGELKGTTSHMAAAGGGAACAIR